MSTANVSNRLGILDLFAILFKGGLYLDASAKGTTPASACVPGLICLEVDVNTDADVNAGVMP